MPLIPAVRKEEGISVSLKPTWSHSEFQDNQGYIVKAGLKKNQNKKRKKENSMHKGPMTCS